MRRWRRWARAQRTVARNWWAKESQRGTPVVVKMSNPNWSMVELEGPSEEDFLVGSDRARNKNAKQLTWVLLLKAHKAAGCLASLAAAAVSLGSAVRRRVAAGKTDTEADRGETKGRFYSCIKVFLFLSVLLLLFEVVAYFKGWDFGATRLRFENLVLASMGFKGFFDSLYSRWVLFRAGYVAPPLQFLANACTVLFLVQSLDRLVLCLGCFWIKLKKIKPVPVAGATGDLESGKGGFFPMVLVQIPMCNEKEVYQQSIAAVCNLDWPKSN